jgi:hypothetical protein
VSDWPRKEEQWAWKQYLVKNCGWNPARVPVVFIFDEAQMTYSQDGLWIHLRNLRKDQYAIVFVSYSSATSRVDNVQGAPVVIPAQHRITLQPVKHDDDKPAVGLFFTKEEFNDLVKRNYSKHCFDETFFAKLFEVTRGHIGAICDFIKIIEGHDVSFIACYE